MGKEKLKSIFWDYDINYTADDLYDFLVFSPVPFFSKELLEYMNRNPLLRHELLVYLYKFKEEHKEKEEAAGAENGKILADR